ncbi:hypothetical protein PA13_1023380 [Pseudomonas aeruginosa HB13]|nr:hypothetical protein PA13_1023380 [Pseudomonas aeruginosa HB13]
MVRLFIFKKAIYAHSIHVVTITKVTVSIAATTKEIIIFPGDSTI